ncbi:MAG: DUF2147 domain-containing protein [Burkholderiales bacterium]
MQMLARILLTLMLALSANATAQLTGLWKIVNESSGGFSALLRFSENNGKYEGRLEALFPDPGDDPNPRCTRCEDYRKDQPLTGMIILWGFKKQDQGYTTGRVLDPDTGNIYRCNITLSADGKKLKVRGYLGIPLFGSTQTWLRAE